MHYEKRCRFNNETELNFDCLMQMKDRKKIERNVLMAIIIGEKNLIILSFVSEFIKVRLREFPSQTCVLSIYELPCTQTSPTILSEIKL